MPITVVLSLIIENETVSELLFSQLTLTSEFPLAGSPSHPNRFLGFFCMRALQNVTESLCKLRGYFGAESMID